jgi:hypothetical protein
MTENRLNLKNPNVLDRLTKFEKARILGTRASQIQQGASVIYLEDDKVKELPKELDDLCITSEEYANVELNTKSTPIIVKRPMPDGSSVLKTVQDL